jgi:SAM-dependent methyltransferase
MKGYTYLLGDTAREARRLEAQARLWDPISLALFDRLVIARGARVLEVGPGRGSLYSELRRRTRAPVDAVERSPGFCRRLRMVEQSDGFGRGRVFEGDLLDAPLPRRHYDYVFARWVFLFLPDPVAHLRKLAHALRPGGAIAIQDYYRDTWALIPRPTGWSAFMAADRAFFASQGGDANVAERLPALFRECGLEVVDVTPVVMSGRPGSAVWKWLFAYALSVLPRYSRLAPFSPRQARQLEREWRAAARRRECLAIAPTVLEVVGRKR